MVYAIGFNDASVFINQQGKSNPMRFSVFADFPRPLPGDAERRCIVTGVLIKMFLQARQLATAVRSPGAPKKDKNHMLLSAIGFKANHLSVRRWKRKQRRLLPDLENLILSWHNIPCKSPLFSVR
jgi:hypothetical protein